VHLDTVEDEDWDKEDCHGGTSEKQG
jgi:hypothetical protein